MVKLKLNNTVVKVSALSLAALTFLAAPAFARDGWDGDRRGHDWGNDRGHHDRGRGYYSRGYYPSYGRVVFSLPHSSISIAFGKSRYNYCDGVFYRRYAREYVVVAPPPGVLITALPQACQTVIINGASYYTCNDIYYQGTPQGYVVVPRPSPAVFETARADAVIPSAPINHSEEFISVNVPNKNGGYTAVDVKRTENGFLGPQGEFYAEFPRVDQLKVMYGK